MTTHIFREYDPQSRRLIIKTSGESGGTTEDESSVILHFTYTQQGYLDGRVPFIVFDVFDDEGKRIYFSPISHPPFTGYTFPIPYAVTRRATQNKLRYVLAFTVDGEDPELIIEQSALDTLQMPHSLIDALLIREGLAVELPAVSSVIKDVSYDDNTSTFTFTRVDNTIFRIGLSDLAEDHFEVPTAADLDDPEYTGDAESGDTATALDTGAWYKLYIRNGQKTWYAMSGNFSVPFDIDEREYYEADEVSYRD